MARVKPTGQVDAQNVPRFVGLRTFARLPRLEDVGSADAALLGAPIDVGATFRGGARFGPAAIREASLLLKPYSEPLDVFPFDDMQVVDAGDAPAIPIDIVAAHAAIEQKARELHERGTAVIGLGGDHSVALPLLRAAAARHGTLSLLQLDSHTDTWDSYFGGYKLTNGTIFRRAIEEGLIDPERSVQIGLRGGLYSGEDYRDNSGLGFKTLLAREFDGAGIEGALSLAHEHCVLPTYVTLDIDVLDPAFAPGTGTPEVGGMTTRELLGFLRGLTDLSSGIVAGDVVEVSPPYDPSGVTALAGANLAWELLCLLARYRGRSVEQMASPEKYVFDSSEGLVESMLGRQLIPGTEHALVTAVRQWLSENDCPRKPHARGRGSYLVTAELAERFRVECWPRIKHLARD